VLAVCVLVGFEAVAPLPAAFAVWQRCSAGLGRVARVLSKPAAFTDPAFTDPAFTDPAFTDAAATDPAATDPAVPSTIVARDIGIEARNIDLRPAVGAPRVLEHSSLRVDVGSRTALIGPSGCGKSTLLAALLRLVPLDSGVIELTHDGGVVDIAALRAADMPPLVAGSLQGDHVFDATLRDNLRVVKPGATDAELDRMAVKAGLTAFVTSLPLGWSTPAGPDGGALSGGQRQRLLLARALLADPHILLLDEPTAHLDADTEREILGDLLDATTGTTVLISTHRRLLAGQVDATLRIESTSITHERSDLAQRAEVLGRVAASMSEGL
jgi:ABC-type transport system involved in cytochrome bd biosynthesis fused ATPase/permease subunit